MTNKKKTSETFSRVEEAQANASLVKLAQEDFLTYCQLINPKYTVSKFHEILADKLQSIPERIQRGERVRIILSVPPRHGKTHTASELFPTWCLGKFENMQFILSNYGSELSEKVGLAARDIIKSERYQSIFPGTQVRKDVKAKRKWMTNKGGSFYGAGVGGPITGTGGNVIIVDDPHKDRAEAESATIRETVWQYFQSTLYSRLEGAGAMIIIMQRWHVDDLVGRLHEQELRLKSEGEPHDEWEIINFAAIAEEDEYLPDGTLFRRMGEPLWPEKFSRETLDVIKSKSLYNWVSQYQQNPIMTELQEFKESYFKYYEPKDIQHLNLQYYTLIDPAISQKQDADNSVVLTVAKDMYSPNVYRIREDSGKFTPNQLIDLIFKHQGEYKSKVYLEQISFQKAFKYSIEERQRKEGVYFLVNETKRGNKEERIRGLLPMYQQGLIFHLKSDKQYEEELLHFPRGKRDDRADCMSFMIGALENTRRSKYAQVFKPRIQGYF